MNSTSPFHNRLPSGEEPQPATRVQLIVLCDELIGPLRVTMTAPGMAVLKISMGNSTQSTQNQLKSVAWHVNDLTFCETKESKQSLNFS